MRGFARRQRAPREQHRADAADHEDQVERQRQVIDRAARPRRSTSLRPTARSSGRAPPPARRGSAPARPARAPSCEPSRPTSSTITAPPSRASAGRGPRSRRGGPSGVRRGARRVMACRRSPRVVDAGSARRAARLRRRHRSLHRCLRCAAAPAADTARRTGSPRPAARARAPSRSAISLRVHALARRGCASRG